MKTSGYDCLVIPGATKLAGDFVPNSFCGGKLAVTAMAAAAHKSVCSK
jgi:hypothetical protein